MLIKLDHSLFLPATIGCIGCSVPPISLKIGADNSELKPVSDGSLSHYVYVRFTDGGTTTIAYFDTVAAAKNYASECAELVNRQHSDTKE